MKAPADCRLIGRWRIVEADLWDRDYLDLCGPATLTVTAQGGEIAFGAMEAGLDVEYARNSIGFRWAGCDEGDEVRGEGTAELLDDGTIEIEFGYDNGDEAVLKAKRDPSSTACLSGAILAGSASKRVLEMQRCRQHPGAYEFCARASVHRALEGFQTIDLPFGLAVAPTFGQRVPDRVNILPQRSNEALHRVEAGSMGIFEPRVEFHVAFASK